MTRLAASVDVSGDESPRRQTASSEPAAAVTHKSFHGVFDLIEYAEIFGPYHVAASEGGNLLFSLTKGAAISGPGASFGGLLFSSHLVHRPRLQAATELIRHLTVAVTTQFEHCSAIQLRLAADIYYPAPFIDALHAAFAIAGWSHTGEATHIVTADTYRPRSSTTRHARRGRERFSLSPIDPGVCFDLLFAVKLEKGYRFHYARSSFVEQVTRFPDLFRCFGVRTRSRELIAASFELASADWALLLNWDQTKDGRSVGAADYLLVERLEALLSGGCRFVDMGTTTDQRTANWGLIRHKENFGGHASLRNTYILPLRNSDPRG